MTTIRALTLSHSTMKEQNIRRQDFHWGYEIAVSSSLGDYTFTALGGHIYEGALDRYAYVEGSQWTPTPIRMYVQKSGWIQMPLMDITLEGIEGKELDTILWTLGDVCRKEMNGWEFLHSILPPGAWKEREAGYSSRQRRLEVYQEIEKKLFYVVVLTELPQPEAVGTFIGVRLGQAVNNVTLAKRFGNIGSREEMKALLLEARGEAEIQLEEILDAVKNVPMNN